MMFEEGIEALEVQAGVRHKSTLIYKANFANLLRKEHDGTGPGGDQKKPAADFNRDIVKAVALYRECAVGFEIVVGVQHSHTLAVQSALAAAVITQQQVCGKGAAAATERVDVVLLGLAGAAEHNGKRGVVSRFLKEKGRFSVAVSGLPREIALKPHNLGLTLDAPAQTTVELVGLVGGRAQRQARCRAGPAPTVRDHLGRLSGLRVSHRNSILCGAFVWVRRVRNRQKRRFLARAVERPALGAAAWRGANAGAEAGQPAADDGRAARRAVGGAGGRPRRPRCPPAHLLGAAAAWPSATRRGVRRCWALRAADVRRDGGSVGDREKQILVAGSGVSLEPPGSLLTHLHTI
jgi:hypothetical protein